MQTGLAIETLETVVDAKGRQVARLADLHEPLCAAIRNKTAALAEVELTRIVAGGDDTALADRARGLRIGIAVLAAIEAKARAGATHYPVTPLFVRNLLGEPGTGPS